MNTNPPNLTVGVFTGEDALLTAVRQAALGHYEILGELGRGGMACVYLAHEIQLDRKVAIKVMLPEVVRQPGMIDRFRQEAKTAGKLAHPNIVPIYAVRDTGDTLFFVMKYIEGRPLDSIIKELGRLPFDMMRTIVSQLGGALDFAHRKGVIHRDIKPANVMIDSEGFALVTDFGVAKASNNLGLTATGGILGTPYYMSPEQGVGAKATPASDQYSLGVMAFEMLTGERPFEDQSYGALVVAHQSQPAPPIVNLRPDCPPHMRDTVERMMAKSPEQRFPTLRDAVDAFCAQARDNRESIRATMITLATTNVKPIARVSTPVSTAAPPARSAKPAKRVGRVLYIGIAVAAAAAIAVFGLPLLSPSFHWEGSWTGGIAGTQPVEFGGGQNVCKYGVSFENTSMKLTLGPSAVQQGTITGRMVEITAGNCRWPAQAPSDHQYTVSSGRISGDSLVVAFNGAESNRPRTVATFRGTPVKRSDLIEGELEIQRTDITGTLAWTITMPLTLQSSKVP